MPKKALTAASVERIKPPTKGQVEVFDKGYPGLRLAYLLWRQKNLVGVLPAQRETPQNISRDISCDGACGSA